jgi:multidrug resistance efflux pump
VSTKVKKRQTMIIIVSLAALLLLPLLSCNSVSNITDLSSRNNSNNVPFKIKGKLEMPREAKLCFGTAGTIRQIFVTYGNDVRAGKLLAKLDDTQQKLAVTQAQYNVEIALNELAERIYSTILGYPNVYPPVSAILRLEKAREEVLQLRNDLSLNNYREAMNSLRLAIMDLEACRELLQPPPIVNLQDYPDIMRAITLLEEDIRLLGQQVEPLGVQGLLDKGYYQSAGVVLALAEQKLEYTYSVVNRIVGIIRSFSQSYPDTATAIDTMQQVTDSLQQALKSLDQDNYNAAEVAKTLRLAQHYEDISNSILEKNDLTFKHGLNLKQVRLNNINLQKAEAALESAKVDLMKTEILAPFNGTVVDVPAKVNDQVSAVDYNARTIVHLVDTSQVELVCTIDEVDAPRIKGKEGTIITDPVDIAIEAFPGEKFRGKITFLSPYGTIQGGTAYYMLRISLDPSKMPLQRGLPATATIPESKKPTGSK